MNEKIKIFVSSVQSEFAKERKTLAKYIREDVLLGDFFEVFLFEEQPARSRSAQAVYLDEVEESDIYLGIFGAKYGSQDAQGVSPTEREYDRATGLNKTRFAFVKTVPKRDDKEESFVRGKIDIELTRNAFSDFESLRTGVYKALVHYLKEDDHISNKPFDESFSRHVAMGDLDDAKFADYVKLVADAGKVSFPTRISNEDVLVRIGLMDKRTKKISNGAIPLFAKRPDELNAAWEIRCIQYYGTSIVKPIPSLHTYTGTVFELVDQAVDFVMSRVNFTVGPHDGPTAAASTHSEFPCDAIREAIVNAVCHRDYTSNACVQVMLFRDRLEIINPGPLPRGLTVEDLYRAHDSIPRNRLIARAMSWTSYVEKSGSGTGVIVDKCVEQGLSRPDFDPTVGFFKTVIWREGTKLGAKSKGPSRGTKSGAQSRDRVKGAKLSDPVAGTQSRDPVAGPSCGTQSELTIFEKIVVACQSPKSVSELLGIVGRTNRTKFKQRILGILRQDKILEWTIPDKPNSRLQKYRLTAKGRTMALSLERKGARK